MAKKNKIPKKFAGMKIPKVLRKNSLLQGLLGSPAGRQIVADALLAAGSAAATALVASHSKDISKAGSKVADKTEDGAKVARRAFKKGAEALTEAISNAAKDIVGGKQQDRVHGRGGSMRTH